MSEANQGPFDVAVVTPSYGPDLHLCEALCRSVQVYLPAAQHYLLVDGRDLRTFRHLEGGRTTILAKEDLLPGLRRLPIGNRWACRSTIRPLRGWLIQQMAKFAVSGHLKERVMLLIDSDTFLVRPVVDGFLVRSGNVRLFRAEGAIDAGMTDHGTWWRNGERLLGLAPDDGAPWPDYISSTVTWDRLIVQKLIAHLEDVNGRPWTQLLAANPRVSEFLVYGIFVQRVLGGSGVWMDPDDRCLTYWDFSPLDDAAATSFAEGLTSTDIAALVSSHSHTDEDVLSRLRSRLTGGQLS